MPRKAREKIPYGTYLIHQSCTGGKALFESDSDRLKFLEVLMEKKLQFHFKIYGCCLADRQGYRMVIYDNGSDISKIMKSINISCAHRMGEGGKIFSQRYKSSLIGSPETLKEVLDTLGGRNPRCSFEPGFSGNLLDEGIYYPPGGGSPDNARGRDEDGGHCSDFNPLCRGRKDCIRTMDQGRAQLERRAEGLGITLERLLSDRQSRNRELLDFRKRTTLSLREIGILFGGLGESAVCKIISRNSEKMKGEQPWDWNSI